MLNGYKGIHRRDACVGDACDNLVPLKKWRPISLYLEWGCRVARGPIAACVHEIVRHKDTANLTPQRLLGLVRTLLHLD
jgi:hypothetical protein